MITKLDLIGRIESKNGKLEKKKIVLLYNFLKNKYRKLLHSVWGLRPVVITEVHTT